MLQITRLTLLLLLLAFLGAGLPFPALPFPALPFPYMRSADAAPDLVSVLKELKAEKDPTGRLRLVRHLLTFDGERAARTLAKLGAEDPSAEVRVGATRALGLVRNKTALEMLVWLARRGGPRAVRAATGRALARREGSAAALCEALAAARTTATERALLLGALGYLRDNVSFSVLRTHAQGRDLHLRGAAVHALVARADDPEKRRALLRSLLANGRTVDELMPVLDAAAMAPHDSYRPGLERALTFMDPALVEAAQHLLDQLAALDPEAAKKKAAVPKGKGKRGRYAPGGGGGPPPQDGPPPLPMQRGMTDTMIVLDATGSSHASLPYISERILHDMTVLHEAGVNVRVGVLLYRGGRALGGAGQPFEVFPLTYDIGRLRAFLGSIKASGVDDRGGRVGLALGEALGRSSWRWRARRAVHFYADGPCGDLEVARRAISIHFLADRTRTRFTYVARTRTSVPAEYAELARRGGSTPPEIVR